MGFRPTAQSFVAAATSGIFLGIVLFEIAPEGIKESGFAATAFVLGAGAGLWFALKKLTDYVSRHGLAIVSALAFWLHSFLEGTVTALSFSVSRSVGLAVAAGMLLHLVPELFAIVGLLKGEGVSMRRSVFVDLGGIAILFASFAIVLLSLGAFSRDALLLLEIASGGAFAYIGAASFLKRPKTAAAYAGLVIGLLAAGLWRLAA